MEKEFEFICRFVKLHLEEVRRSLRIGLTDGDVAKFQVQ